jgi:hypothetical protein
MIKQIHFGLVLASAVLLSGCGGSAPKGDEPAKTTSEAPPAAPPEKQANTASAGPKELTLHVPEMTVRGGVNGMALT